MGFMPRSISLKAAKSPQGPSPTTITFLPFVTSGYSVRWYASSVGSSFTYTLSVRFTITCRCLASMLLLSTLTCFIVLRSIASSLLT